MKSCNDDCKNCKKRCDSYYELLEFAENGGLVLTDISNTYWGHTKHILTKKDISRLLNGKHLFMTDGEYTHEIYYKEV